MALERWKCQNNDDDFDAFLINSKILSLSFFIGIRAHLADLDMNATDYDGRMSTKQTILNSIMMMMIQSTFAFSAFKILILEHPQEGQLYTWLPVRDTLPASGDSTMFSLLYHNQPVSRFLLEVCEVEAEPRDRWGHTPLWDAQMFSRCFKTTNSNFSLVVWQF